jgi:hypothetical protein
MGKLTYGNGIIATAMKARREVAHWYPSFSYTVELCEVSMHWTDLRELRGKTYSDRRTRERHQRTCTARTCLLLMRSLRMLGRHRRGRSRCQRRRRTYCFNVSIGFLRSVQMRKHLRSAKEYTANNRHNPMHRRVSSPSYPEQADRNKDTTQNSRREAKFRIWPL